MARHMDIQKERCSQRGKAFFQTLDRCLQIHNIQRKCICSRRATIHKFSTPFMATKQIIKPAKSAPAVGPYNHAVRVGDLLFCAGQIPIDPATSNLVTGEIKAQTERVLQNIQAILEDQKLNFANVVKSTVFLTNLADFAAMNE